MKNKFWFGVILTISILLVVRCFEYADAVRGSNQTKGAEVFMIVLPLMIVFRAISKLEQKLNRKNEYIQKVEQERLNV
jgi:hypothetical protein